MMSSTTLFLNFLEISFLPDMIHFHKAVKLRLKDPCSLPKAQRPLTTVCHPTDWKYTFILPAKPWGTHTVEIHFIHQMHFIYQIFNHIFFSKSQSTTFFSYSLFTFRSFVKIWGQCWSYLLYAERFTNFHHFYRSFWVGEGRCVFEQLRLGQGEGGMIWPVTLHWTYYPWNRIKGEPNVKWYKWRILKHTYPHTEGWGDEWFIIKPKAQQPFCAWHVKTVSLSFSWK